MSIKASLLAVLFKTLLQTPELMNHWLKIYAKNSNAEIPALEGRIKSIESDIQTSESRVKNLISRIAELPPKILSNLGSRL